jgi:hypothetical protein
MSERKELELQREIEKLTKEIDAIWPAANKRFLDLRAEIDHLKLEVISLKKILMLEIPSFEKRFTEIFNEIMKEVPPE